MKLSLSAPLVALLVSSTAIAQIGIPGHASTYNGFSRGFNFTANTDFIITQLDLPPDAFQAGDTASYMVRVNGVEVLRSVGNAGAITPQIVVDTGDVVDVIGNWSPAATDDFSAHNSYGNGPFNTTIEGVAHTIQRTGWQWDIGDPGYASGAYLSPSSGQLGRVLVYTAPPVGLLPYFSATPTSGNDPLTVQFTDETFTSDPGGVLAWNWDFDNDGTIDSATQNPTHVYPTEGTYSVTLTAVDQQHGIRSRTRTNYIKVGLVDASFTFSPMAGFSIQFNDTSAGNPTSWAWDFDNNGTVDSTQQNPTHTYPGDGTYTVSLRVTDAVSSDTITTDIGVAVIPIPPYSSTYTFATHTRGFWFQTPVRFSITGLKVPDESAHGLQNVAVYNLGSAPPFGGSALEFASIGQPSTATIPAAVSFEAGDYVGILGGCGDATTMRSSYGAGPYASSIFGQPITLTRLITQTNIAVNNGATVPSTSSGSIARVEVDISAATGIAYGTGTPSGFGPPAPTTDTTQLPIIGQTAEVTVNQQDTGTVIGFIAIGFGRANVTTPFGTILVNNLVTAIPMNGGMPLPVGASTFQINVPNNAALNGAGPLNLQNINAIVTTPGFSMSDGQEWFLAF